MKFDLKHLLRKKTLFIVAAVLAVVSVVIYSLSFLKRDSFSTGSAGSAGGGVGDLPRDIEGYAYVTRPYVFPKPTKLTKIRSSEQGTKFEKVTVFTTEGTVKQIIGGYTPDKPGHKGTFRTAGKSPMFLIEYKNYGRPETLTHYFQTQNTARGRARSHMSGMGVLRVGSKLHLQLRHPDGMVLTVESKLREKPGYNPPPQAGWGPVKV